MRVLSWLVDGLYLLDVWIPYRYATMTILLFIDISGGFHQNNLDSSHKKQSQRSQTNTAKLLPNDVNTGGEKWQWRGVYQFSLVRIICWKEELFIRELAVTQKNGFVERKHIHVLENMAIMFAAKLPNKF